MSVVDCGGLNMDEYGLGCPTLWIPAYAGMTVRKL